MQPICMPHGRSHKAVLLLCFAFLLVVPAANSEETAGYQGQLQYVIASYTHSGTDVDPCEPSRGSGTDDDPYIYTLSLDHFASSTGYFRVDGCSPTKKPTLSMKAGFSYMFVQEHISNWMHPIGFAYYPDGAHAETRGKPFTELEFGENPPSGGDDGCDEFKSCQSPQYYRGTEYLGNRNDSSSGLNVYEPEFKYPQATWVQSKYNVRLSIKPEDTKTAEIFYLCHIHNWMSGRIIIFNADGRFFMCIHVSETHIQNSHYTHTFYNRVSEQDVLDLHFVNCAAKGQT